MRVEAHMTGTSEGGPQRCVDDQRTATVHRQAARDDVEAAGVCTEDARNGQVSQERTVASRGPSFAEYLPEGLLLQKKEKGNNIRSFLTYCFLISYLRQL